MSDIQKRKHMLKLIGSIIAFEGIWMIVFLIGSFAGMGIGVDYSYLEMIFSSTGIVVYTSVATSILMVTVGIDISENTTHWMR